MTRDETGRYLVTSTGGEQVRAFVPAPLPPVPALDLAALLGAAAAHAKLSIPAAANAMRTLEHAGIVRELTGRKRNRLFSYDRYVNIISEGT